MIGLLLRITSEMLKSKQRVGHFFADAMFTGADTGDMRMFTGQMMTPTNALSTRLDEMSTRTGAMSTPSGAMSTRLA